MDNQGTLLDFLLFCRYKRGMAKKRGRPPVDPKQTKGVHLDIRLALDEKEAFKGAAELSGMALSVWIRQRLRKAAREELEEANLPVPFLRKGTG